MSSPHPQRPPSRTWRIPPDAAEFASLWFSSQRRFISDHAPVMKQLSEARRDSKPSVSHRQHGATGMAYNLMSCDPREMCVDAGMGGVVRSHHNQVRTLAFSTVQDLFGRCSGFDDDIHRDATVERNKLLDLFRHSVAHSLAVFMSTIAGHLDN